MSVLFGVYFAIWISFLFNPIAKANTGVKTFTREIGIGLLRDYDAARVNSNFVKWFIMFAIALVVFTILADWFLKKYEAEFLKKFIIVADVDIALNMLNFFQNEEGSFVFNGYLSSLIFAIIIISIIYSVANFKKVISKNKFIKLMLGVFAVSFPIMLIFGFELFWVQVVVAAITMLFARVFGKKIPVDAIGGVFAVFPLVTSLFIEHCYIRIQKGKAIDNPKGSYIAIFVVLVAIAIILSVVSVILKKKSFTGTITWIEVWIVTGVAALSQQIPFSRVYQADIFESANYGVMINDYLQSGKIPLVETLGLHMMQGVWEGVLYAFVTGDYAGAVMSPYAGLVVLPITVCFYFLVRKVWDERIAIWVVLLLPFYKYMEAWGWGLLIILAIAAFAKKNTYLRGALVWICCVWVTIYKGDVGMSFTLACFGTLLAYVITEKNWSAIKQLLIPLAVIGVLGVGLWWILCSSRGINPATRLMEFYKIFASTINWTYDSIGDNTLLSYAMAYIIMPFVVIISCFYLIWSKTIKENVGIEIWVITLGLGFAYIGNFGRTLARHSMLEGTTEIVFWTGYLFIACMVCVISNKKGWLMPVFIAGMILNALLMNNVIPAVPARLAPAAESKASQYSAWDSIENIDGNEARVKYSDDFKMDYIPYKYVMEILLSEDETFLDFTHVSFLYAYLNRPDPVYAVQIPTSVSGEMTQECFIDEMKANLEKIPVVIMPNNNVINAGMDGVLCSYKYYKIAEFIYENYIPLVSHEEFSVWCLYDKYGTYFERLNGHMENVGGMDLTELLANNCTYRINDRDELELRATGDDPFVINLEKVIDLSACDGLDTVLSINYATDTPGGFNLFYTVDEDEEFSGKHVIYVETEKEGTLNLQFHVTKYTKLRFDIPEDSLFVVKNVRSFAMNLPKDEKVKCTGNEVLGLEEILNLKDYEGCLVNFGINTDEKITGKIKLYYAFGQEEFSTKQMYEYDVENASHHYFTIYNAGDTKIKLEFPKGCEPELSDIKIQLHDELKPYYLIDWNYAPKLHDVELEYLPLIWGELDEKEAYNNEVLADRDMIETDTCVDKENGNYVKLSIDAKEEEYGVKLLLGYYDGNEFVKKGSYIFNLKEGKHDYLFRVSTDWFWEQGVISAFKLETVNDISGVEYKVLRGD